MVKPSKKLKKVFLIVGITGMVYAGFRYLLPLVIPFLAAYIIALGLRPSAVWIQKKLARWIRIPVGVIGGIQFLLLVATLSTLLYIGIWMIGREISLFSNQLPLWIDATDEWLTGRCHTIEDLLYLEKDCLVRLIRDMLIHLRDTIKEAAMPFLMMNSVNIVKGFLQTAVIGVIIFLGTILSLEEMDSLKKRREESIFWKEYEIVGNRLVQAGKAWLRTQGSILIMTIMICMLGLWILKNPYFIVLGILIGLLDALPILGTGTIFVPWAAVSMIQGHWGRGIFLLAIYIVCYFLREFMEARIMGNQMGLTPLESLVSLYVGWKLFGLLGFVLGPVGLILIEDIVEAYDGAKKACSQEG
ncbi:AI-2E family transporter [Lachnospiraceae bacterium 62-35]